MAFEVANLVGAVVRTVTTREHDGKPARVIIASATYDTGVEDLWDAMTNPERLPRWFLPVSGDLRLGGRYQLEGNAGGTINECDAPRRLAVTWEYGGGVSWLNVDLAPEGADRASLTLEHIAEVPDELWDQFGPGAAGVGWDLGLYGLTLHLAGGGSKPADAETWPTTPEGRAFVAAASQAWAEASVASGTPRDAAEKAAAATTAFYTGSGGA